MRYYYNLQEKQAICKTLEYMTTSTTLELSKRQAQYQALQNQINPHFLYNTLESIRSEALISGLDSVADMCEALAGFFRYTISNIERTKICGGGAKSPLWRQMVADILNIKVDIPKSEEGPSMGGAMLAAVACGEYASVEEAAEKIVEIVDTVEPILENAARYEKQYQKFRRIYPTVKELFPVIE